MITINNLDRYSFEDNNLASYMEIGSTVAELKELLQYMSARIRGNPSKKNIVNAVSDYILKHVNLIFTIFPQYDLHLLKELVDAGEHGIVTRRFNNIYPLVANYSLVAYSCRKGEKVIRYIIPDDLRLALKEGFEHYHPTDTEIEIKKIMQTAEGLVNLYGLVPASELFKQLGRLYPTAPETSLQLAVNRSLTLLYYKTEYDGEKYLCTPYYLRDDMSDVIKKEHSKYTDIDYFPFSIEDADTAGSAFFHGTENIMEGKLLEAYTNDAHLRRDDAEFVIEFIWRSVNLFGKILEEDIKKLTSYFDIEKQYKIENLIKIYSATVPRWFMKGNTPLGVSYVREKNDIDKIILSGMSEFINSKKTVERNDPCPCGSGKKYKKCCGK